MNSIERRWSLSSSKGTCFRQWPLTLQKRIKKQHLNLFAAYWDTKTSKKQRGGFCIAFFFTFGAVSFALHSVSQQECWLQLKGLHYESGHPPEPSVGPGQSHQGEKWGWDGCEGKDDTWSELSDILLLAKGLKHHCIRKDLQGTFFKQGIWQIFLLCWTCFAGCLVNPLNNGIVIKNVT